MTFNPYKIFRSSWCCASRSLMSFNNLLLSCRVGVGVVVPIMRKRRICVPSYLGLL